MMIIMMKTDSCDGTYDVYDVDAEGFNDEGDDDDDDADDDGIDDE